MVQYNSKGLLAFEKLKQQVMLDMHILDIKSRSEGNFQHLTYGLKKLFCMIVKAVETGKDKRKIFVDIKIYLDELFRTFHQKSQLILKIIEINYLISIVLQNIQAQIKNFGIEESLFDHLTMNYI